MNLYFSWCCRVMNRVTRAGQGRAFRARAVCCCADLNGHACWSRLVFDNGFCDHDFCFCMMCFPSMLGVFGCRPVGGSAIERKSVGGGWNKSAMGRTRGEERNSKFECIDAATIHNSKVNGSVCSNRSVVSQIHQRTSKTQIMSGKLFRFYQKAT